MGWRDKLPGKNKKMILFFSLIFFICICIMSIYTESYAEMVTGYPRQFQFNGVIQLQYRNYLYDTTSNRSSNKNEYSLFEQRYNFDLRGYVYHPRLIVFNSTVDFVYLKSLSGMDLLSKALEYNFLITALPYRPVSLDIFASRQYYAFESSSFPFPSRTINHYGAKLKIDLQKYLAIRFIQIGYEHWDYGSDSSSDQTKTDSFSLAVRGLLTKIKTRYVLSAILNKSTNPIDSSNNKFLNLFTESNFIKNGPTLYTTSTYSEFKFSSGEYTKDMDFNADLDFPQGSRFYHEYGYNFQKSEHFYVGSVIAGTQDKLDELSSHIFKGSWGYRFTERLMSSLILEYGKRTVNNSSGNVAGLSASLSYSRSLAGFNLQSSYRFMRRKDELADDSTEHSINISITRPIKFGTAYLHYYLIKSDTKGKVFEENADNLFPDTTPSIIGETKVDTLSHTILLGIRGRGYGNILRRATWTLEGSYYTVNSHITRPIKTFVDEVEEITFENIDRKINQYSFYWQLFLPIRNTINFYSRAAYTFGDMDSISKKSLIIHARLNYIIYRNLTFSGLWRGRWDKTEGQPNSSTFDYQAEIDYRIGRMLFTLEYYLETVKQDQVTNQSRRIFFTLKRYI
jgi:hypothetical protein